MKLKFYRVHNKKGFRIYYPKTFISRFKIPDDLVKIEENVFDDVRSDLVLFFNTSINRYILYKEYKDKYVMLCVVDNGFQGYREPGDWLLWELRKADIFKGGSVDPKRALKEYEKSLDAPSEGEKERDRRARDLQEEMMKDFDWVINGRTSYLVGHVDDRVNKKVKKEKQVFGFYNGKLYKRVKKNV